MSWEPFAQSLPRAPWSQPFKAAAERGGSVIFPHCRGSKGALPFLRASALKASSTGQEAGLSKPSQCGGIEKVCLGSQGWILDLGQSCKSDLLAGHTALGDREKLWFLASRQQPSQTCKL